MEPTLAQPASRGSELRELVTNMEKVIVGKRQVIELLLVALLSDGHVLIEDVPGTGKTMLARALARSIDSRFSRIQFTPDLLPSDVTGIYFFNQREGDFEFRPGPIISNIVLADEINRATPRTQSSLLEAMEERRVTVEGVGHDIPKPFMVLATQNPIELEGTFPLPEAQLDRFMLRLDVGYPSAAEEEQIILAQDHGHPIEDLEPVVTGDTVLKLRESVPDVHVSPDIRHYVTNLVRSTREHDAIELGVSPRGSLALHRGSQAHALIHGRTFVSPDDVKYLAPAVLAHRLVPTAEARLRGRTSRALIAEVAEAVPVPVEAV